MKRELRDWLLDSPALTAVSLLVLDAARLGLIDIEDEIARAVSFDARMQTLNYAVLRRPHMRRLKQILGHPPRLGVRIDGGVAVLDGVVAKGCTVRQSDSAATLETSVTLPETLVTALQGRPLSSLVTSPLLDGRDYVITSSISSGLGADVTFRVPAIPIAGIRMVMPSLRTGFAARPGRGRARSR